MRGIGRHTATTVRLRAPEPDQGRRIGGAFKHYLTSPIGIGMEVLMLSLIVALMWIDWQKRLGVSASRGQMRPSVR